MNPNPEQTPQAPDEFTDYLMEIDAQSTESSITDDDIDELFKDIHPVAKRAEKVSLDEEDSIIGPSVSHIPPRIRPRSDEEMRAELEAYESTHSTHYGKPNSRFHTGVESQKRGLTASEMQRIMEAHERHYAEQAPVAKQREYISQAQEKGREVQANQLANIYRIFNHPRFRLTELSLANEKLMSLIQSFMENGEKSDEALMDFLEHQTFSWKGKNGEALSTTLWNIIAYNAKYNSDPEVRTETVQIMKVLRQIKQNVDLKRGIA